MDHTKLLLSGQLTEPQKPQTRLPVSTSGQRNYGSIAAPGGGQVPAGQSSTLPDVVNSKPGGQKRVSYSTTSKRKSSSSPQHMSASRRRSSGWSIRGNEFDVPFSLIRAKVAITLVTIFSGLAVLPSNVLLGNYLTSRQLLEKTTSNTSFTFHSIQADVIEKQIYYNYTTCFPALLVLLVMTAYSDFIGRRIQVLLACVGQISKLGIVFWIMRYNKDYNYFYLAYLVDGLCGSWFLGLSSILTCAADINLLKTSRTRWLVVASAVINISFVSSFYVLDLFMDNLKFFEIAGLFTGYAGTAFVVALFLLPETLPPPVQLERNPLHSLGRLFSLFLLNSTLKHRFTFFVCLIMFFFACIGDVTILSIDIQYLLGEPFFWNLKREVSYAGYRAGISPFAGILLLILLQRCRVKGEYIAMVGSLFMAGAYCLEGAANTSWHIYMVIGLLAPATLVVPTLRATMSVLAGPEYQGSVFSSIAIIEILATLVSNSVFNTIYSHTVDQFAGTVYMVMAAFAVMPFFLFFIYFAVYERGNHEFYHETTVETPDQSYSISLEESKQSKQCKSGSVSILAHMTLSGHQLTDDKLCSSLSE